MWQNKMGHTYVPFLEESYNVMDINGGYTPLSNPLILTAFTKRLL